MEARKLKLGSDEKRIVWGEVYIPDIPDTDGEFMNAASIEKMAYDFMRNLRLKSVDSFHNNQEVEDACVIESFIARKGDPDFIEGAWVIGMHIPDDEAWGRIKKGEINGFSMEALVTKTPVTLEIEVPPVLSGMTQKSAAVEGVDVHDHEFHVSYDESGKFLGGRTGIVNGHFHVIKRGTVTEDTAGHRHRFAHVDVMKQAGVEKLDISGADLSVAGKKNPEGTRRKRRSNLAAYLQL